MSDGLSRWWPTPARPADHFSAEQLERSARWHRPVHRLGSLTRAVEVAALVGAGLVLGRYAEPPGTEGAVGSWPRALLGSSLTVGGLRLPGLLAEWRVADAIEPGDGYEPGSEGGGDRPPFRRFVTTAALGIGIQIACLAVVAAVVVPRLGAGPIPWLAAGGLAGVGLVLALVDAATRGGGGGRAADRPGPPPGDDQAGPWIADLTRLARRSGVDPVGFALIDDDGPNACAIGFGSRRRVLVDRSLIEGPTPIRDFIVAHELSHLARHHPAIRAGLGAAAAFTVLAAPVALAPTGRPWSWFGLRADDPLAVPVAALVVLAASAAVSPVVAWVLRALERSADAGALATVGPLDRSAAVALHLASGVELDPPRLNRLYAQHPSPAERLEMLARGRDGPGGARRHDRRETR